MCIRSALRARAQPAWSVRGIFILAGLVCLIPATASWASDADGSATDTIARSDIVEHSRIPVGANERPQSHMALAGSGSQAGSVAGHANTGSGRQDNALTDAADWHDIVTSNAGSGAQVIRSADSNGRDRTSDNAPVETIDVHEVASTITVGTITGRHVNQGSATQVNAANQYGIERALAGSGSQAGSISGHANTGSGGQDTTITDAAGWHDIENANAGSGAQVIQSPGSSGRGRESNALLILTLEGDSAKVSHSVLDSSVTNNSLAASGVNGSAGSSFVMRDGSQFSGLLGVNTIVISSGSNASQNVNVSLVSSLSSEP